MEVSNGLCNKYLDCVIKPTPCIYTYIIHMYNYVIRFVIKSKILLTERYFSLTSASMRYKCDTDVKRKLLLYNLL